MIVDHAAPEPPYAQLAQILRERIRSGELPPRSLVPSLHQLAAEHQVAVKTVQKAIAVLKAEGLVFAVNGRGTYVS